MDNKLENINAAIKRIEGINEEIGNLKERVIYAEGVREDYIRDLEQLGYTITEDKTTKNIQVTGDELRTPLLWCCKEKPEKNIT